MKCVDEGDIIIEFYQNNVLLSKVLGASYDDNFFVYHFCIDKNQRNFYGRYDVLINPKFNHCIMKFAEDFHEI